MVLSGKMFEKHLWKSEDAVDEKHFASKNQLPGFYIGGTSVENGLTAFKW